MRLGTAAGIAMVGLAALAAGCRKKVSEDTRCQPYYDAGRAAGFAECERRAEPQQQAATQAWTEEMQGIHYLNDREGSMPDAIFIEFDGLVVMDSLLVKEDGTAYLDFRKDGSVDEITAATGHYRRGDPGTEEIFKKADKAMRDARREIGVPEYQYYP